MKKLLALLFAAVVCAHAQAQSVDDIAIITLVDQQVTAWNQGSIDKFMETYWKNDSLVFVGKEEVTYGYENTLQRYKKAFPDTAAMGRLLLSIIQMRKISADHYFVLGKYQVKATAGNREGHFTLLLRKIAGRWKIVCDHSS